MLAEMQSENRARESSGGKQSSRNANLGMASMTDSVTSVAEDRARPYVNGPAHEGRVPLESPFADSLSSKPFASSISRRYAMAGTSECAVINYSLQLYPQCMSANVCASSHHNTYHLIISKHCNSNPATSKGASCCFESIRYLLSGLIFFQDSFLSGLSSMKTKFLQH